MKIYTLPDEVPAPVVDYSNYNHKKAQKDEENHQAELKQYLIGLGYDKPLTGEILQEPMADGYALYMVMDGGRNWGLIHLPYGDAYDSPNVQFLPKAEVKRRIQARKNINKLFSQQKSS